MMTDDPSVAETVSLAYRVLVLARVAVGILVGLATVAALLGWL